MEYSVFYAVAVLSIGAVGLLLSAFLGLVAGAAAVFIICRKLYNWIRPQAYEVDLTGVKIR